MKQQFLLGIDQGGSGSRATLIDSDGRVAGYGYRSVPRVFPRPGWVEQDPLVIAQSVREAITEALRNAGCPANAVLACGFTSQRDTVFAWDRATNAPIGNAITWQDLRTADLVAEANTWSNADQRRFRLGQFPGAYSSAMHMAWRMRHDPAFRRAADEGRLACSLAAGWLIQALGRLHENALDVSLIQGMTVFDYRERQLWGEWIAYLDLPAAALPRPVPTLFPFGEITITDPGGSSASVPVLAMISDQQAALFGYDCRTPGMAACTHGTASFLNMCAGHDLPAPSRTKTYRAWELDDQPTFSLEADTTVTGAVVRWMQEQMGWLQRPADLDVLAASVPDAAGVVFVPAFTGLGVPTEDRSARGSLLGMTLDTTPAHVARAFLDAIALQLHDIVAAIHDDVGMALSSLYVGGGLAASDLLCQIQADVLGVSVVRAADTETSVRAAALLAGIAASVWRDERSLPPLLDGNEATFEPRPFPARDQLLARWQSARDRAQNWLP